MSSKKGIISTLLVIQLVFLLLITMSNVQLEKQKFSQEAQFNRIAAYKVYTLYGDVFNDINYLKQINATGNSIGQYVIVVNNYIPKEYGLETNINSTHIYIHDKYLEISKEGLV